MDKIGRKNIKMVALDLDGTTLNSASELTPRTREVIRLAMEQGVHIVISTGRPFHAIPVFIRRMEGLEYIIHSNGAGIMETTGGTVVYENCNEPSAVDRIVELLREADCSVDTVVKGTAYIDEEEYNIMKEQGTYFRNVDYVLRTRTPRKNLLDFILEHREEQENISLTFRTSDDMEDMARRLSSMENITVTSSFHNNLEIGGPTTSKADALKHLMNQLDVHQEELLACGDSPNDSQMIELAGIGVVMGNATEHMKAQADYITDTNDNDGVAKAIQRFVLESK